MPDAFDELQRRLEPALGVNRAGSTVDHVLIALPSFSVSESILSHYADRIPSLEHRYLFSIFIAGRIPACEIVYISTRRPDEAVIDYYTSLVPPDRRAVARFRVLAIDDGTTKSVAGKIAADPSFQAEIRAIIAGRPAFIEPWNVTETEQEMALALGVPINGTRPDLRSLGFKSAGRRLFRDAGVPLPDGREDVHTIADVEAAILDIRARGAASGVVIKHDDSGAGDGNVVLDLTPMDAAPDPVAWLRTELGALPDWYRADLATQGGVVEERVSGARFTSPSAQVDIRPDGSVQVLATHEQVLGGPANQVYLGCRFPADPDYAPELARHAHAIGEQLSAAGALGRFAVDFVAASDEDGPLGGLRDRGQPPQGRHHPPVRGPAQPRPGALRRRGGPVGGQPGRWRTRLQRDRQPRRRAVDRGSTRSRSSRPCATRGSSSPARTGTGVVLFMLSGLAIDGRFGIVAIGRTPVEAEALADGVRVAVDGLVA